MSAVAERLPASNMDVSHDPPPGVVFVTPHKATYFKPLYEAFALAQPEPWRTVIVWPAEHRSEHPQELLTPTTPNIEVRRIGAPGFGRRFLPGSELAHALEAAHPRLVVIQEYSPFSLGALRFARKRNLPVVVITEVGRRNRHLFGLRTRWWHSFCSRFVDGIAAACPAAREPLSGRRTPSVAIYHAVDSRDYHPLQKQTGGSVTFAYLGQLIPRKGLDLWLQAARLLREGGTENFRLRIIGGGDETWLRGVIAETGLGDKIDWRGFQSGPALREALGTADVFVLPTRADTYAAVVHEAACLGLPLIVSRHAGASEPLVCEDGNGFVVDPADAGVFAKRMQLLMDGDLRARMGPVSRAIGDEMSAHRRGAALWRWMEEQFAFAVR